MELSGQRTQGPCAVERDAPQEPGSKLGPGASAFHQRIISNNSYARDQQADKPGQGNDGSTVSSIICDRPLLTP